MEEAVLHTQDVSLGVDRQLRVVDLAALLSGPGKALQAVFDPLERPAQADRCPREQNLLGIKHHDLGPEAAADERSNDPHLRLEQPEHPGESVPYRDRSLGRVPDRELFQVGIPGSHHAAGFDRCRDTAVIVEAARDHQRSLPLGLEVVSFPLDRMSGQVGADRLVDDRGIVGQRALQVHHRLERLRIHYDVLGCILSEVTAGRHYHGDRLAHMADLVPGQGDLGHWVEYQAENGWR